MSAEPQTFLSELGNTVGAANVSPSTADDVVDGVSPLAVLEPKCAEDTAAFLGMAAAEGLRVAPRGGGTKMDWGTAPREIDVVLSTKKLNQVVEHAWADMTATVQAGCTISKFQETLSRQGQYLAVDPLWPKRSTVGGVLATNDSGALRIRFGGLRDLVIGITVALPGGVLAKSGGKVVKNVAGYDLQKLLTGSFGTLGVITEATFRLYPLPHESRTLSFSGTSVDVLNELALGISGSKLVPTGVQVLAGSDRGPQLDVRFEGITAAIDAQLVFLATLARSAKGVEEIESAQDAWDAREKLWCTSDSNCEGDLSSMMVCKVSILSSDVSSLASLFERITAPLQIRWELVAQSIGICTLRLDLPGPESGAEVINGLRRELEMLGGCLIVLRCPSQVKAGIDVWGDPGDAAPLMRRVKNLFDPAGVLNPERFVGGI